MRSSCCDAPAHYAAYDAAEDAEDTRRQLVCTGCDSICQPLIVTGARTMLPNDRIIDGKSDCCGAVIHSTNGHTRKDPPGTISTWGAVCSKCEQYCNWGNPAVVSTGSYHEGTHPLDSAPAGEVS